MSLEWIDTHVHWDATEFDLDRDAALVRARQAGVVSCLNPSVMVADIDAVRTLGVASQSRPDWPLILPAFGIHPLYVSRATDDDLVFLDRQLSVHRPVAVGEIGLDGYAGAPDMNLQRRCFEAQLALAVKHTLPVLLHSRHAVEAVIHSLKRVQRTHGKVSGGIAHAFNGSESQAAQLMDMGFLLGFGGSLTYEGSTRIRRLATILPLTHLVLETDAPDMAPVWLRGARNESTEMPKIARVLAELRGTSVDALSEMTCTNVRRLLPGVR